MLQLILYRPTFSMHNNDLIPLSLIIRGMAYYRMTNERSIPEFIRLITALQSSDKNGVATPEGWQPGDKVNVPGEKSENTYCFNCDLLLIDRYGFYV